MADRLPRDVRIALGMAALALGLVGMAGVVVGYVLAVKGETIPAFIGMIVGQVLTGLTLMGRWVLSYQAGDTKLDIDMEKP